MGNRCGVGSVRSCDDLHFQPLPPKLELFDRSGPERIARGEQDGLAPGLDEVGQLGCGGRLSGAVDADD